MFVRTSHYETLRGPDTSLCAAGVGFLVAIAYTASRVAFERERLRLLYPVPYIQYAL